MNNIAALVKKRGVEVLRHLAVLFSYTPSTIETFLFNVCLPIHCAFTTFSHLKMNITEEDLPDYFFPDDHPTRGTGNANSTRWTKTNKKKLFLTGLGVVAVYVWYRRRHRQQNQTYQSQHDYSGKGMRVGSSGETGGIGSKFGSLTSRIASESDEKKLEAAR